MKKLHLFCCMVLFFSSCKSYDFLEEALFTQCTSPSILFVQVISPCYNGSAMISNDVLESYYIPHDTVRTVSYYLEQFKITYNDIKYNKTYVCDEQNFSFYSFEPLYNIDSDVYLMANRGIDTFIQTYFDDNFFVKDTTSRRWQIAKIMFDAGILIRVTENWEIMFIDDPRFYTMKKNGKPYLSYPKYLIHERRAFSEKKIIPKSYIRKGKYWYKNRWQKKNKRPIYVKKEDITF